MEKSLQQNKGEDLDCEAYLVACDYLHYRPREENLSWHDCPALSQPTRICLIFRSLCSELEARHAKELCLMAAEFPLLPSTSYITFQKIAQEILEGKIVWGKIVALCTFGGVLAVRCIHDGKEHFVSEIADWIGVFIEAHLHSWIQYHGGWKGITTYYDSITTTTKNSNNNAEALDQLLFAHSITFYFGSIFVIMRHIYNS